MRISRRGQVAPFQVMDVLSTANALALSGETVFHLEAGEPGGPMPVRVREAAERALADQRIGYTEPLGLPALRSRIAAYYGERYDCDVAPSRVVITAGASAGFILAFLAAFDVGDRVAAGVPGYPAYTNILEVLGLEAVALTTTSHTRFQPTARQLETAHDLAGVIVQSPANPSGTMLTASELADLCGTARDRDIAFISDEIYHGITFGAPAETALRHYDEAIVINSFSKYFCMTGWRIGWMVAPEALVRPIECLAQNLFISPNALSQYAALGAFEADDELQARVEHYRQNRDILLNALNGVGIGDIVVPDGGFYLYCDVSHFTNDSEAFCKILLRETGVATTPGTDFDRVEGRRTLRLSFAGDTASVTGAASTLRAWLSAHM